MIYFFGFSLGVLVILYFFYRAHLNTRDIALNEIRIDPFEEGSHFATHRLSVLHISDMHLEHISISPQRLYRMLSDKKIDLIALTGDYMDRPASIPKLAPYLQVLRKLRPQYGMYAVLGNHDYVLKAPHLVQLIKLFHAYGCRILQNEHVSLNVRGITVNIIGIDDYSTDKSDLARSYEGIQEGFNLVLTHDPNIVLEMGGYPFDYMLAGHFHGGQIHWPKPYHLAAMGRLVKMDMVKGLQRYGNKLFYISEGLGQTGINIRIGSRPEITLHHLALPKVKQEYGKTTQAV